MCLDFSLVVPFNYINFHKFAFHNNIYDSLYNVQSCDLNLLPTPFSSVNKWCLISTQYAYWSGISIATFPSTVTPAPCIGWQEQRNFPSQTMARTSSASWVTPVTQTTPSTALPLAQMEQLLWQLVRPRKILNRQLVSERKLNKRIDIVMLFYGDA